MIEIYFLARHTPFWAVPIMVMAGEFGYVFWLKKKKRRAYTCLIFFMLGLFAVSFYAYAGGPEKTVRTIKKFYLEHK